MNDEEISIETAIIRSYLSQFRPLKPDEVDGDKIMKTSADIQDDLADMCEVDLSDIAKVMVGAGYRIALTADKKPAWAMHTNR